MNSDLDIQVPIPSRAATVTPASSILGLNFDPILSSGTVTGLLLSNERYNRGLAVDRQALGLREASENSKIKRDNS